MSTDLRNSLNLWIGGLAFFGLFWAGLHFDVFKGVSDPWLWPLIGVVTFINLSWSLWGLWRRRTARVDNPSNR